MKNRKFYIILLLTLSTFTWSNAQVNPVAPAIGFTNFIEGDATLKTNETESNIAIGGDLYLQSSNYRTTNNTAGSVVFGNDARPTGLLINGKIHFNNGSGITVNGNAWVKVGDCTGANVYDTDQNGASSNLRITSGSYNTNPRINLNTQQPASTVCQSNLVDFTTAFNTMRTYSSLIATFPSTLNFLDQNGNTLSDPNNPQQTAKINVVQNTVNVLNTTPNSLDNVKNFTFQGGLNGNTIIIINIDGGGQDFDWKVPAFGGQNPNNIFWNFVNIPNLKLTGGNTLDGTLYAPNSNLIKDNAANIQGSVIAKTFYHKKGELHENPWTHNLNIIIPSTCLSTYPIDSVGFDPTLFTLADNVIIGLDDVEDTRATAFGDYDGDGYVDIFIPNYAINSASLLYHNNGDGTFTKVTSGNPIVTDLAPSTSGVWGDYDNDGDLDLYVSNNIGYGNFLYRNEGNGNFISIQNDPIVNYTGYSHGASWADYDNDGYLDMFITDFFTTRFNKLYHNNGDGTFTEVTSSPLVTDASFSVSAVWGDYDNDGDQDLFVANTSGENNFLYRNEGNGQFTKITTGDIVNDGGKSTGASWGDYDNDMDLDLFVANAGGENNFLYENNGDGTFTRNINSGITANGGNSHGSAWADIDNDGDLDLVVSNDASENNFMFLNNGDGTFAVLNNDVTQDGGKSFGLALADIDNDCDLDIHISNIIDESNNLYINELDACNNKVCFTLVGTATNVTAYGSKIKILATINGVQTWQMREISALTGGGFGGQNDIRAIFGVGDATQIDSIYVEWASGYVQKMGTTAINTCHTITEQNGSTVCGSVYYDNDIDCQFNNTNEGIAGIELIAQPGNIKTYTDANGYFEFNLAPGIYTITQTNTNVWTASCSTSYTINVTAIGQQYCGNNFANTTTCPSPDLYIDLSTTALRVGFENLYAITFGNNGAVAASNANVTVDFGAHIVPLSASLPWDSKIGTEYTWNIGTIELGQEFTIYVEDSVLTTATIGDNLVVLGVIDENGSTANDCDATNNIETDINLAVGAIDPNDIAVSPEGFIANDQELVYKIRFQNVGNNLVNRVILRDELPEGLDLSTLVRGTASHPYQFRIEGERTLVWEFGNINLPDSISNEPESHGFVTFKITPKVDLPDGTELPNKAAIFFDNSAPVITNTVINTIGEPNDVKAGDLAIYPNPMTNFTTLRIVPRQANLNEEEIQTIEIYTILGLQVASINSLTGTRVTIERGQLSPGYYIVKVKSNKGLLYSGKLLVTE